jgi:predicted DNA-binding protein (MmcQ/YjbR family)
MMMSPAAALERLRPLCLRLPEVTETSTFGNPTFIAGKRTFAVLDRYKGAYAIAFKATHADQAALTMDPRFYVTPYSGKHGWTSLHLSDELDWNEVRALVESSYRLVALKRMLRELDDAGETQG